MVIRTGLLCVPQPNDVAVAAVWELLRSALPNSLLVQSTSASSQRNWIEEILRRWCDEEELDLVITIGDTAPAPGSSSVEIVPEATLAVVERQLPGLAEAMRRYAAHETPLAWLDRSVAWIRGRSLIVNLPAHAAPATLFLEAVVDLLEPALSHLHEAMQPLALSDALIWESPTVSDTEVPQDGSSKHTLDPNEFAAFLLRRQ